MCLFVAICYSSHKKLIHSAAENVTDTEKALFLISWSPDLTTPNPEGREEVLPCFHAGTQTSKLLNTEIK